VNLASRNVARLLNLDDRGEILRGKRADIIICEVVKPKLKIARVYLTGKRLL
jgi:alpha-D-ribose 1-methylphosphonate 5-triphosphate diphosphatase PhnM